MPITLAPLDTPIKVVKVLADEKTKRHLESLGILVNSTLTVLSSINGGVVVAVKDGRLALDAKVASKILVAQKGRNMLKRLDQFLIGETGLIKKVEGEGRLRRRLLDMGVTPGANVYLRKKAPLGDPLEITIRGYELTLRKSEAELVFLEVEDKK